MLVLTSFTEIEEIILLCCKIKMIITNKNIFRQKNSYDILSIKRIMHKKGAISNIDVGGASELEPALRIIYKISKFKFNGNISFNII